MPSDLIFFKLLTLCFLQTPLLSNITCTAQMWPDTDHVALSSVCACVSLYVGDTNVPAKWLNWSIWYFGCGLMYTRNHIWYKVYTSAIWQIWWINLCSSGHVAQCQITLTTCLIYPASSSHTTCPNYMHLPFLITKPTDSNPNSSLHSTLLFNLFTKKSTHLHLIILTTVLWHCWLGGRKGIRTYLQLPVNGTELCSWWFYHCHCGLAASPPPQLWPDI